MTARRAGNGGTHGSRPTGCGGHPGRTGSSAPTKQNKNRAKRDVGDGVPYTLCHCEERSDAAIRSPQPEETDSHASDTVTGSEWQRSALRTAGHMGPALRGAAVIQGGRRHPPLQSKTGTVQNGTSGTACPTHSVIARSEATRQSVLPSPKRRIPVPVCTPRALASRRALARNDSAARWERRDTWVPPYGVRRSSWADRVVRPYKAEQEPRKTGCGGHPGRAEASAPTRQNRNRAKRDGGDGVPYE